MGFRTGVRLPSGPLNVIRRDPLAGGFLMTCADANERSSYTNASAPLYRRYTNTRPSIEFSVFNNVFGITLLLDDFDTESNLQTKKAKKTP